jgi:mannan endo-1,4-beta-mannosidase
MPTDFRFRGRRFWRGALFLAGVASLAWGQANQLVQRAGGTLTLNGAPFRFGGTNSYPLMYSNQSTVNQILQTVAGSNLKIVRMWVFCDTTCGNDYFFQYWNTATGAPTYNDQVRGLDNVDLAVNEANTLGIKLIMTLTNNWTDFGGMDTYVTWNKGQYHDQFYTDPTILQWYESWVSHVLNHVNTIPGPSFGVAYKNDPTIMAWELANEPECGGSGPPKGLPTSGSCGTATIVNWIAEAAKYIKSIDSNHLVAVGDEGFICDSSTCSNGVDSASFSEVADVDFVGFHLYPDTWGWSIAQSNTFIANQESIATNLGKPLYMGEFGLLSGNAKESIYNDWTNLIFSGGGSGAMFWDVLPGVPTPANAESASTFDEYAGTPVLPLMSDFAEMMAGSTQQLPPVAGDQWATTPFGQPVTVSLDVLSNDVGYGGATIDPTSINLGPNPQDQQTSLAVTGGVFNIVGQTIQFTPQAGFVGTPTGSYTVKDSNQQVSNVGYLFVTVNPAETCCEILESFESGADGWGPATSPAAGTVAVSPNFSTEGKNSLQVNVTTPGWFGVTFPAPIDLSSWPSLAVDITPTTVGGYPAIAFQSGPNWVWCQTANYQPLELFGTTTLTLPFLPTQQLPSPLDCYGGTPDFTNVRSLPAPVTYYIDNLRAVSVPGVSAPLPVIAGIANSAGGQIGVSPGAYISIYGSNFMPIYGSNSTLSGWTFPIWSDYVVGGQLPTTLAGISVSMGGTPAYVEYVSPTQINVLAPNLSAGRTSVTVTTPAGTSEPYSITSTAVQPAFFEWPGNYVVATDSNYDWLVKNGTFGTTTAPARPGETVILWGTGFGPTTPAAPAGQLVPPNSYSVNGVTVTLGGTPAAVIATALSPGLAGVYQVAITVPSTLANGDYPIVATVGGVQSPSGVKLTVQQ